MSNLDNSCIADYWSCCESSVSSSKFNAFSAETEEKINDLQEQIDNIEASGLTYEEGDYIQIDGNVISVSGINPSDYALKSDLDGLSGKVETISGDVVTISGIIDSISAVTEEELDERLAEKQDKLTEGAFIDIDTNNVISAKISVLTRNAWESLVDKDPTVLYLIRES